MLYSVCHRGGAENHLIRRSREHCCIQSSGNSNSVRAKSHALDSERSTARYTSPGRTHVVGIKDSSAIAVVRATISAVIEDSEPEGSCGLQDGVESCHAESQGVECQRRVGWSRKSSGIRQPPHTDHGLGFAFGDGAGFVQGGDFNGESPIILSGEKEIIRVVASAKRAAPISTRRQRRRR